jgi:hypothetical protein
MNEKPLEWMAECGEGGGHKAGRMAALAAVVALFVFFLLTGQFVVFLVALVFVGLFAWLQMHAFVEYEFCYFDDEMDVAAIYNRARRKKKMTIRLADVEYMVKKEEPQEVTKYFCNRGNLGSIYTLVANIEGKRTGIVLEADPEFVKIMEMKRKIR